jgi:hypothetical protein
LSGLDITPFIRELILLNECVILRGVGGFETKYKHAVLDRKKKIIAPPSKIILFHPDWVQDNGVLENHLKESLDIEQQEASELIDTYVNNFFEKLKTEGKILLEGIGEFIFDNRQNLIFHELEGENYLADSFGLDHLDFRDSHLIAPHKIESALTPHEQPKRRLTGWYIAIGILLLVISVTLIILISEGRGVDLLNLSSDKKPTKDEFVVFGSPDTTRTDSVTQSIEKNLDKRTSPRQALALDKSAQQVTSPAMYYLIAGSFNNNRNAQIQKELLIRKGFSPEIMTTGRNYRVVVGKFTNRKQAITELRRLRAQLDQSVWLLEMKNPN